uniref:glycosyl hydrolase n=1 Tax=Mariniflexile sp. TaxID=1979402 RepID=UPI0040476D50
MKKYLAIIICSILISSCEKNVIGDFEPSEYFGKNDDTQNNISKKGVAFTNKTKAWSHKTSALGAHWMYSWGNVLADEIPENVEYVPMFWGKGSVNDENINRIKQLIAEGKVKYVLGFNEPDGKDQANMSVDEAIALWPRLEEIGVPLGSPAVVGFNNGWFQEFMQKAVALNLRIDFIAVHSYGGPNVLNFINNLKGVHEAYNKPLWITEFAVADWTATSPANNKHSEATVIQFMQDALGALEDIDWIHRYAWFDGGTRAPLATSALFSEEADITTLGQVYAAINRNNEIGPGQDTEFTPPVDLDELLVNGGFEAGEIIPWGGFKNGVVGVAGTEPKTGNFCGNIQNNDGTLFQVVTVEPGKTYILKFWSKWREAIPNTFTGTLRNNDGNALLFTLPPMPQSANWEETTYEFTIPDGVTNLKIVFYKGQVNPTFPPFYMDDVSLKLKK